MPEPQRSSVGSNQANIRPKSGHRTSKRRREAFQVTRSRVLDNAGKVLATYDFNKGVLPLGIVRSATDKVTMELIASGKDAVSLITEEPVMMKRPPGMPEDNPRGAPPGMEAPGRRPAPASGGYGSPAPAPADKNSGFSPTNKTLPAKAEVLAGDLNARGARSAGLQQNDAVAGFRSCSVPKPLRRRFLHRGVELARDLPELSL
jgi:hypothetical protein